MYSNEYQDNLVRSAINLIKKHPGWIMKRIALELSIDYNFLYREFGKRNIKMSDIRKTKKQGNYQKFESQTKRGLIKILHRNDRNRGDIYSDHAGVYLSENANRSD